MSEIENKQIVKEIDDDKFMEMRSKMPNGKWLHICLEPNGGSFIQFLNRNFHIIELVVAEVKDKKLNFYIKGAERLSKCEIIDADIFIMRNEETDKPYANRLDLFIHSKKNKIYLYSTAPVADLFNSLHIYIKAVDAANKNSSEYCHFAVAVSGEKIGEPPIVDVIFDQKANVGRCFCNTLKNMCKIFHLANTGRVQIEKVDTPGEAKLIE